MTELIKPVRYGILIGLFGLVFGIGWAFWLVLGHERIHKSLDERAAQGIYKQGGVEHTHEHGEEEKSKPEEGTHAPMMGEEHHQGMMGHEHQHGAPEEAKPHSRSIHEDPIMELSHTRLRRGHIHAMGLSIVTIALALVLMSTSAPERVKIIAPILTGLGGLIYPFAWIVMGYRTPLLGPDAAEASVTVIAGTGIALVLIGIFTAGVYLLKDIFLKK
ncbi:MAG: hypothetical protein HY266_02190 [Deltaproteobacteria bacterium]|nr:hypothetical protein [Deltaproteobacteria bacterium]